MPHPLRRSLSRPRVTRQNSSGRQGRSMSSFSGSRAPSQNSTARGSLKTDMFTRASFIPFSERVDDEPAATEMVGSAFRQTGVRRWDGNERTTTNWDFLRRDPELWFPDGDCLVHFYGQGHSRRGPSLRLSLAAIESSNCRPLLERACAQPVPDSPSSAASTSSDDAGFLANPTVAGKYELYIPAPSHLSREEAFKYHLTTRNFFAWMFERPVAGSRLGEALISLLERMNEYRPDAEENQDDMLAYLDSQEYTDFRECPDHALAVLQFAERFQYRDLWTDAFVHCAGMNDNLAQSVEFESISRTSKALITRAHLEMDLRLEHAGRSLGNFLEDDLSGAYLGLGQAARVHLERFRSFLQSFYVGKYGYWPPTWAQRKGSALPKSTYRSMYFEFRNLYDYLVDPNSTPSIRDNRLAEGGICALQNVTAFDRRNKYNSLPHPLPRVPEVAFIHAPKPRGLSKVFGSKQAKLDHRMASLGALSAATNSDDMTVMECSLVREYFRFEREWTVREDEKISSGDARKVRWILIYAVLQTLISVTRAPTEVRDTEGVSYPLCCQTAGTPPWTFSVRTQQKKPLPIKKTEILPIRISVIEKRSIRINTNPDDLSPSQQPPTPILQSTKTRDIDITPDLTFDYFAMRPQPLITKNSTAKPAIRSRSLARTLSTGRTLSVECPQPRRASFSEILMNEYDARMNTTTSSVLAPDDLHHDDLTPTTPGSTSASSGDRSASPRTPGGSSTNDDMDLSPIVVDHLSICGSESSVYGDGGADEYSGFATAGESTRREMLGLGKGSDNDGHDGGSNYSKMAIKNGNGNGNGNGGGKGGVFGGSKNGYSVESFGSSGRWNPEVESYVGG